MTWALRLCPEKVHCKLVFLNMNGVHVRELSVSL
jgi:hypothetical protein